MQDYGAKGGYTMVLEASNGALLYSDKSNDITDEIVKIYNTSPRKSSGGKGSKSDD